MSGGLGLTFINYFFCVNILLLLAIFVDCFW